VLYSPRHLALRFADALGSRLARIFGPRIGVLWQHTPHPLRLAPTRYVTIDPLVWPRISIVTPSYNQGQFLERTIKSVLDQGYPNLEYIIQDGASRDGSPAILERYRDRIAHLESTKDRGQTHALNMGFQHATGTILAYLNSDDLLLPDSLTYVAQYFDRHPNVDAIYSHRIVIDEDDQEIGRWLLPQHDDEALGWLDTIPQETLFWRRRLWDQVGASMDESFQFAMDWDLLLRFRDVGARFRRVPRFLGAFRRHSAQKTTAAMANVGVSEIQRIRRRYHGREVTEKEAWRRVRPYLRRHLAYHVLYRCLGWNGDEQWEIKRRAR
jgi:carbamoyltransferase